MKLVLYNNFSETNQLNKIISKIIELEGSLLDTTSIINPVIKIFFNPESMDGYVVDDNKIYITFNGMKITWDSFIYDYVLAANYAYIPEFNRYYFINDIISIRRNIWQLIMNVDVLMSYKDELLKLDAFIVRNEFDFNKYVKDDMVSYYYDKEVIEYVAAKGDKVNTTFHSKNTQPILKNCLISVINDQTLYNTSAVTPPSDSLPEVENDITGACVSYNTYCTTPLYVARMVKHFIDVDDTLSSYVISVVFLPFDISNDGDTRALRLGETPLEDVHVYNITPQLSKYHVIADFTITGDSFMDYDPYTKYELYIPYLSYITVSADDILNNRIIVYYVVDYQSGSSQVTVYDVTNGKTIYTSSCQLGVKIGVTSTNAREVMDAANANNIGLAVGVLTSVLSIAGGVATSNPVAVVGGLISGGSSVAKYIQNQNTNYQLGHGSVSTSNGGIYASQEVKIRITRLKPKNYNDDYAKLYGKPLNEYRKLSTLHGFTTVGNIHIENIASATRNEHDQLKALLEEGIIL